MEFPSGEKASYNFYRILRSVWKSQGISRTDLATLHGLDKTTVSQIVSELTDAGVVTVLDIDTTTARPGRKAELLAVDANWGMVAGLEVRPDGINAVATDMHGEIVAAHHHRHRVDRSNLRDAVFIGLESLQADDRCSGKPVIGVGVGVTGIVRRHEGMIVHSIPLNIEDPYDFNHQVARHLPVPVVVDNDANCCAWGELVSAKGDGLSNLLFLLLEFRNSFDKSAYGGDIGLGLGFVLDGKVYYGPDGSAGEFRSLFWHQGFRNQFAIPDEEATDILNRPDVLPRLVEEIAQHVAVFVNTLNLRSVYVGGDVSTIRDLLLGTIRSAIVTNWPYLEPINCTVEVATHPRDMVAIGAAAMVLEHIFGEPSFQSGLQEQNAVWRQVLDAREHAGQPLAGQLRPASSGVNAGR